MSKPKQQPSRSQQRRKARRILRQYLQAAILATADDVPADVRTAAQQRVQALEPKLAKVA